MWAKQKGFTIVELLIVIVVIGILASISIVAYSGVQQRARDTVRKDDLNQIAKAIQIYASDNGNFIGTGSGCGSNGNGNGWYNFSNGTTYPLSISDCLKNSNVLTKELKDPSGLTWCSGTSCRAYIKYTCGAGTYLYANLETLPAAATDPCGVNYNTTYGMNYILKVD